MEHANLPNKQLNLQMREVQTAVYISILFKPQTYLLRIGLNKIHSRNSELGRKIKQKLLS